MIKPKTQNKAFYLLIMITIAFLGLSCRNFTGNYTYGDAIIQLKTAMHMEQQLLNIPQSIPYFYCLWDSPATTSYTMYIEWTSWGGKPSTFVSTLILMFLKLFLLLLLVVLVLIVVLVLMSCISTLRFVKSTAHSTCMYIILICLLPSKSPFHKLFVLFLDERSAFDTSLGFTFTLT